MTVGMAKKKANIVVDMDMCKLCGICVEFCPMKNLLIESQELVEFGRCIACFACVQRCPDYAITVKLSDEKETATG